MSNFSSFINKKYLILFLIAIFLTACSHKKNSYKLEDIKFCKFPDNPSEYAPMWVCNFNIDGYPITGVGSTKTSKAGMQFMIHQASAHARVSMAQELRTKVSNEIADYIESKKLGNEETIKNVSTSVTSQITEAILVGSKLLRTTTSANGTLYVLMGLTPESYQETLKNAFNKAIPTINKDISSAQFSKMTESIINNR